MPNDVINTITIGNTTYDIGGSGHIIEQPDGTDMTQRSNLQFVDATVTDDSTNDRTKVETVHMIDDEDELDDLPDGLYIGDYDDDGNSLALEDLSNVAISNLTNDQVLKYNSTLQKWVNADESGGSGVTVDTTNHALIIGGSSAPDGNDISY